MYDFNQVIEQYHKALQEFMKGNPNPQETLFSHREDVSLANPFGGIMFGWESVKKTLEHAASFYKEGTHNYENVIKYVTPELAYLVEVEKSKAKFGGRVEMSTVTLRVTSVFRREDGVWRLIHRHADPLSSQQSPESVIKNRTLVGGY